MDISTRTSEGLPSCCPICEKRMIVSPSIHLGDAICPHCGALIFPTLHGNHFDSDDEKRLADLGVMVETDDEGEVITAELHGPRFNDESVLKLAGCNGILADAWAHAGLLRCPHAINENMASSEKMDMIGDPSGSMSEIQFSGDCD